MSELTRDIAILALLVCMLLLALTVFGERLRKRSDAPARTLLSM